MPPREYPGVFPHYVSQYRQAFLDRALYLPKQWTDDRDRRQKAGVPDEIGFATKGELAQVMLARAFAAGVPVQWGTADEVYGNNGKLRWWLHAQKRAYVLAVGRAPMI